MTTATVTLGTWDVPSIETREDLVRALVLDRWRQATTRPQKFEREQGFSGVNSPRWARVLDDLELIGARLVEGCEVHDDALGDVVWNRLSTVIGDALVEWAVSVELGRSGR